MLVAVALAAVVVVVLLITDDDEKNAGESAVAAIKPAPFKGSSLFRVGS